MAGACYSSIPLHQFQKNNGESFCTFEQAEKKEKYKENLYTKR